MLLPAAFHAQLNGIYTIDNTLPASTTNFTSFTQFASTLNAQGVSGAVTVNVGASSGPYNEQINIIQYTGASATNSVVINGNGRTITFNATNTALRHTIMLSGADYMTWNDLRVIGTNATSALVVHLWGRANYNTFNNMYIEAPVNGSSTTQVPFSISGSSVSATSSGGSGSYNAVNSCTIIGGYYNTVFYGNFGSPVEVSNEINNSICRDFYLYGVYNVYCTGTKVRGNIIDRANRSLISTTYGVFMSSTSNSAIIERNWIRDLFPTASASSCYGIYISGNASSANPIIVRNNVVSDLDNNSGTMAGIYMPGGAYTYAYHNTISLDDPFNTGGTTYGVYSTGANQHVVNNNITITRAGTGTKYGLYFSTAVTGMWSDYNNIYVNSASGTNYFGYKGTTSYVTLANWQTGTGHDVNSLSVDPQYANPGTYDYSPTNVSVNNEGLAIGVLTDILNTTRSILAPDPGAFEVFNSACSTAPPTNSFIVPSSSLCSGAQTVLTLQNTNTYTNSGYVVQWYASTSSSLGPFAAIPNAINNSYFTNPIMQNTYFQAVVTCTNTNQSLTTPVGGIFLVPPVNDTVPYYESFESKAQNGLPNCSWSSSYYGDYTGTSQTPMSNNRVARTGTGYAYFASGPNSTNYFYSNQILLKAGITYSAAIHYLADDVNYNPWAELSLSVGFNQTPAGQQNIATISPVTGQLYNLLSGTFSVNVTGYYNVSIKGVSAPQSAPFLTLDDLSITIPCSLNSPTLVVLAPQAPVCQGTPVNLVASGADNYSWNDGTQGAHNTVAPPTNSLYIVTGVDNNTHCSASVSVQVNIKPTPVVSAFSSFGTICSGKSTTLSAAGADIYDWSNGASGQTTAVSPTTTTIYMVAGTNSVGCTSHASVVVNVNTTPQVQASATPTTVCKGEPVSLSATGGDSFQWLSEQFYSAKNELTISPQSSAIYTVTGTSSNGCSAVQMIIVNVEECVGLTELNNSLFNVYPNPASDMITVSGKAAARTIAVSDVSGRIVLATSSDQSVSILDLRLLSAGVYYISILQGDTIHTEKIIKH